MSHTVEFTCQDCRRDIISSMFDMQPVCWICRCIRLNPMMPAAERARLLALDSQSSSINR